MMDRESMFKQLGIDPGQYDDLHVTRMLHAFVAVSHGEVVATTEPLLEYCPLVAYLYAPRNRTKDRAELRGMVVEMTREKIARFGHFTDRRELERGDIAVPYGASEMMMFAMRKGAVDCAVTVCDGAGTVIADRPDLVQGIGARMNGLFYTSPIRTTIRGVTERGGRVLFPDTAAIDQVAGVREAARLGRRNIAVTVNGCLGEPLAALREVERECGASITIIVVCTTGAARSRVEEMREHADMVWSCASGGVREVVGGRSIVQVSTAIPVFAVTPKGVGFLACYQAEDSPNAGAVERLDLGRQYLIAGNAGGMPIRMGRMDTFMAEAKLPVRSRSEPRPMVD